jgi:DNA-binding NtrC family response regulator
VRELENAIERAVAVSKGDVVLPSDLPFEIHGGGGVRSPGLLDDRPPLAELERRYINLVLAEAGGNKKKAAEKLGIDRRTLYRALERAGVAPDPDDGDDDA